MMGAPRDVEVPVMDEMGAMWTMGIMAWPGEIRELGHSEGSECGYL